MKGQNRSFLQVLFHFLFKMKIITCLFSSGLYLPMAKVDKYWTLTLKIREELQC